jgi:hypothetical protein
MSEDIPEGGAWPEPDMGKTQNYEQGSGLFGKFYTEEWLFALVSQGITFGYSMSGFPPSIVLACACWAITLLVALHYVWVWCRRRKVSKGFSIGLLIIIPAAIVFFFGKPIKEQYIAQHSPPRMTPMETNVMTAVGEIQSTLTNKPTFQLGADLWEPYATNATDVISNNVDNRLITISFSESLKGLNWGDIINLRGSNVIHLKMMVYGKQAADDLIVELVTPWMENGTNIMGGVGWQDLGETTAMFPENHSMQHAHRMKLEFGRLVPSMEFIPLPALYIPNDYAVKSFPIQFTMYSKNSNEQSVGVTFNLN